MITPGVVPSSRLPGAQHASTCLRFPTTTGLLSARCRGSLYCFHLQYRLLDTVKNWISVRRLRLVLSFAGPVCCRCVFRRLGLVEHLVGAGRIAKKYIFFVTISFRWSSCIFIVLGCLVVYTSELPRWVGPFVFFPAVPKRHSSDFTLRHPASECLRRVTLHCTVTLRRCCCCRSFNPSAGLDETFYSGRLPQICFYE